MIDKVPFCGEINNGIHRLIVRIYFADTDFSGVVYHGRYLEFLERGRTEFLRVSGIHHAELASGLSGEKLAWVVRKMQIEFLKPAHIDDILFIDTQIEKISGARILMKQTIQCDVKLLISANVEAALINNEGRPRRFPTSFIKKWHNVSE